MLKRFTSLITAAALVIGMLFSLSACADTNVKFLSSVIDLSSFSDITSRAFMSMGEVIQQPEFSVDIQQDVKIGDETSIPSKISIDYDGKGQKMAFGTSLFIDENDLELIVFNENNGDMSLLVKNVLDKPFKVPISVLTGLTYENITETEFSDFSAAYQKASQNMLSNLEIKSENTDFNVNSIEQSGTKMSVSVPNEKLVSFLNEIKEPLSQIIDAQPMSYIYDGLVSLGVVQQSSEDNVDAIISSVQQSGGELKWTKITRLGKLVEETITLDLNDIGKLEFYFNEKSAAGYSTGTIDLSYYDKNENDTVLFKINYTDDNGALKTVFDFYNLFTLTVKNTVTSSTEENSESTSSTTFSLSITALQTQITADLTIDSTIKEQSSEKTIIDITGNLTSDFFEESPEISGQITVLPNADFDYSAYTNENCYVLTDDQDGISLYTDFIKTLEEKYPSLKGYFPSDLTIDSSYTNPDMIANIYGADVSVSPYLYALQNNRDYYQSYFTSYEPDKNFEDLLQTYDVDGTILADYITDKSKNDFLFTQIVGKKFDELGLTLSFNEMLEVANSLRANYSEEIIDALDTQFGLSEANLRYILSTNIKQEKIIDYYFGSEGTSPITEDELKSVFESDFLGVRFILLQKTSVEGTEYTEEEMAEKKAELEALLSKIESGEITMDEAILKNSDMCYTDEEYEQYPDYTQIMDENNEKQKKGYTIDKTGISETDQTQFTSEVTDKLLSMTIGDYAIVEDVYGLWLIQRVEAPDSYESMESIIRDYTVTSKSNALFEEWEKDADCVYDNEIILKYDVKNLEALFI